MAKQIFIKLGFKKTDIDKIISSYPVNHLTNETLIVKINELYEFLLLQKYKKYEIIKIITQCPSVLGYDIETVNEKFDNLFKIFGSDEKNVKRIVKNFPKIISYDKNKIISRIDHMKSYDFTDEQIKKITIYAPSVLGDDENLSDEKIDNLLKFGFGIKDIVKLITKLPNVLTYATDTVNEKLNFFYNLGYTKEEVCKMIVTHPQLLSYKIDANKRKFEELQNEGFTYAEVLMLFKNMPGLFSGDFSRHLGKIRFLREIELENVIFETPKNLIQSVELTYARYNFLKDIEEDISALDFSKLFYDNERFAKKFNKTREQLLEMYSYDEYLKEKELKNGYTK